LSLTRDAASNWLHSLPPLWPLLSVLYAKRGHSPFKMAVSCRHLLPHGLFSGQGIRHRHILKSFNSRSSCSICKSSAASRTDSSSPCPPQRWHGGGPVSFSSLPPPLLLLPSNEAIFAEARGAIPEARRSRRAGLSGVLLADLEFADGAFPREREGGFLKVIVPPVSAARGAARARPAYAVCARGVWRALMALISWPLSGQPPLHPNPHSHPPATGPPFLFFAVLLPLHSPGNA
jgi:hypothetical protein